MSNLREVAVSGNRISEFSSTEIERKRFRVSLRAALMRSAGLTPEICVRMLNDHVIGPEDGSADEIAARLQSRGAVDDLIQVLVEGLGVKGAVEGLAAAFGGREGCPGDDAGAIGLTWYYDDRDDDSGVDAANLRRCRVAVENRVAEAMGKMIDSASGQLQPLDLSRPPEEVPFLVTRVLAANQPCVLGGPYKSLKTGVALDLAVSLAGGVPFLGRHPVPRPCPVAVFSGESGGATLHRTVANLCRAKGIEAPGRLPLRVYTEMPSVPAILDKIGAESAEVVVLDPLYQLLDGENASNLYVMGQQLRQLAGACLDLGATPVLVHHAVESLRAGAKPGLSCLAFAGVKQFARQWILLNRRVPYNPERPNQHRLWFVAGGSAGHSEAARLNVDEGACRDGWQVDWPVPGGKDGDPVVTDGGVTRDPPKLQTAISVLPTLAPNPGDSFAPTKLKEAIKANKTDADRVINAMIATGHVEWVGEGRKRLKRLK